ncbi:MAG TPA: hypothetical protein VNT51_07835, partial [Miltoncostaeaceae bacterium]|nr:hypothetical protein [Miltoncostaeaceae bacterium]
MSRVLDLRRATREATPRCCHECVFWQQARGPVSDGRAKERWARGVEERTGAWGRILRDGDRFRGVIQYGPARAFPR